ncbi:YoaW1 [Bacillus amyloliquefaciens DSM 7]|uniref:YoaW1 n=2 Tax=Bacillaceae TaxID=186817 RepID=A0A9P1JH83_BACAS|nr:YoaW1 [Bacillus amyloliquefaciens DSM 7] [Bacillus amyloliquefaciens DSM 7 = ATCC 23350]
MADDTNERYWPTKLGYRFTIFNAEGCTLNVKLQSESRWQGMSLLLVKRILRVITYI